MFPLNIRFAFTWGLPYIYGVLIRFDDDPEHLRRLQALFINELQSDIQKLRERVLDYLIEFIPLLSTLKSVHTADSQQTLQARIHRICIIGAQQLKCYIQETRPLLREIVLKNFLQ